MDFFDTLDDKAKAFLLKTKQEMRERCKKNIEDINYR